MFRGTGFATHWDKPGLVIIDYAAAKCAEIGAWLRSLMHGKGDVGRPPLRLLLIERTGGTARGPVARAV